jgi:hypothetical protein
MRFSSENAAPEVRFTDARGRACIGTLENESYSGIAASLNCECGLSLDVAVSVDYFGYPMPGVIRRLVPKPDGTCIVGIEWV